MFICFEGLAGSGKTTQVKLLADYLKNERNKEVFVSAVYEGERKRLVSDFMLKSGIKADPNAMMFLFQALHASQYQEVKQALDARKIVIADRWRPSFFAHHLQQDTLSGDRHLLDQLDSLAYRMLEPDIYFLIDTQPLVAYERYLKRESQSIDGGLDLMDKEYFLSVYRYYSKLAETSNWHVIKGESEPTSVSAKILEIIEAKI